ncbi:MAG: hypothetical protein VX341_03040 [Bdellovibrionota bacterium]|nr:hypothetical protein [Bdellovibrionota bacterium]
MKSSQTLPIIISLVAAFLGAWAQYFYKLGATRLDLKNYLNNHNIFLGMISFTLVLILFIWAFRIGGKMYVVYPVYATTYIWGGLIAFYLLKESFGPWSITGALLIILGVMLISFEHLSKP